MHENQTTPASHGIGGQLHICQKSQLTELLQSQVAIPDKQPGGNTIIIDGSALIQSLPPYTSKSFDEYAREDITQKVESYFTKKRRVDIVFDAYISVSLILIQSQCTTSLPTPPNAQARVAFAAPLYCLPRYTVKRLFQVYKHMKQLLFLFDVFFLELSQDKDCILG